MRKPIVWLAVLSIPVLVVGTMAVIGSVQSVADTIEGTKTVTVKSCSYSELRMRSRRGAPLRPTGSISPSPTARSTQLT